MYVLDVNFEKLVCTEYAVLRQKAFYTDSVIFSQIHVFCATTSVKFAANVCRHDALWKQDSVSNGNVSALFHS